jgi:cytochrome c oxidase assembly protein subunit 11
MTALAQQNRAMMGKLLLIVVLMLGFAYALVPMYRKICEVIGINATRDVNFAAANTQVDTSRSVSVELVSAINQNAPVTFEALDKAIKLHPGEITTVRFRVTNRTDRALVGHAVPSYSPARAGRYLTKLECFCFANQTFRAGETRELPVRFFITRELPEDIGTMTLAYTFFDVTNTGAATTATPGGAS